MKAYPNPLIPQRADPWVLRHEDGTWLFTASVPEYDRIELRRACSIEGLAQAEPVVIWRRHESGPMSLHIWAPEIHFIDGAWYVYFAASETGDIWKLRPYVLVCEGADPLRDAWRELGEVGRDRDNLHSFTDFSLDATTFSHRGVRYLIWAEKDDDINSNLHISAMANPWTITGRTAIISRPELDWERIGYAVNEGPAVLIRNGRVFVAYSASATDHHYCMGLLSAPEDADLLDPASWTKSPVPVFETCEATGQYGPGHNSFTVDEDGADVMVYHARSYRDLIAEPLYDPNRHARAMRFGWNADGTPAFGVPWKDTLPGFDKG